MTIKLTREEVRVLKCILQGYSSKEASSILNIPKNSVNAIRKNIFHKFGARSVLHLVVMAILEYKYYNIIRPDKDEHHTSESLTSKEVEVAKLLLQGFLNKEVARMLNIGVRTVEFHRENFKQKTKSQTYPDFVRACLQNGLLKIIPTKSTPNNDNQYGFEHFHVPQNFANTSSYGWIYFDHRNRFMFHDYVDSPIRSYLQIDPLIIALYISGIPQEYASKLIDEDPPIIEYQFKTIDQYAKRSSILYFFQKLNDLRVIKTVVTKIQLTRLFMLSRLLFIEHIAKSTPKNEKLHVLRLNEDKLHDHETSVLREFQCHHDVSLIAQAIHIGVLDLHLSDTN